MELFDGIKQALEYTKNREYKKAEKLYLSLLRKDPKNPSLLSFLGLFYYNVKFYTKAEKYLLKSHKLKPSDSLIFYIGMSKFYIEKYQTAIPYLTMSKQNNDSVELYGALISCYKNAGCYYKALEYAIEAHKKYPFEESFLEHLSFLSLKNGLFEDAEKYSMQLLKLSSKNPSAWHSLGLLNEILYQNDDKARECFNKMVKYGDKIGGYLDLAISYGKDFSARKKTYYYINKLKKMPVKVRGLSFVIATYYFSRKHFKRGYPYFMDAMFDTRESSDWLLNIKNKWQGEKDCQNETLLIYGDQGIGDQIQFIRYVPYLLKYFKLVKIMVHKSLVPILRYSFSQYNNVKFYPLKDEGTLRNDKLTILSFIPYYLNKNFNHIPSSSGYLIAKKSKIEKYKRQYFSSNKFKIGICWEPGATGLRAQIHRTLNIELFESIINMPNASIYSFQVSPSVDKYKQYPNLIDLGSTFKDFSDTAAAIKNIDIMVTIDTSVAHLAGSLGVKTLLILPYSSDWRWFENTERTEWYDSIIIFKQNYRESWDSVFNRIKNYLDNSI